VRGETGVGKDVAARAVHRLSGRRGRLVAVNIAEIPSALLEAELFGAVPGAYTGAASCARKGLATSANHGTLFIDEIGDLDLRLQVKLLRFLDSREVRPVGSDRAQVVDVRIVSATHQDLEGLVAEGRFRQDLYYRIRGYTVNVPPLRERRQDILELRDHLAREAVVRDELQPARWSREADSILRAHRWPGNGRELKNVVKAALLGARGGVVQPHHLGLEASPQPALGTWAEALARCRRELIEAALLRHGGNRTAAARELKISRQTLLHHLHKLGIRFPVG